MATVKHIKLKELNSALPKETAELFQIKGMETRTSTKFNHPKFGTIDLTVLSIEKASFLVAQKADFIEKKPKANKD